MSTARPPRFFMQRSLGWLLWLALLLPMAQSTAAWHRLSHAVADTGSPGSGKQALHDAQCDLCLTAAGVDGGALPGTPLAVPVFATRYELPRAAPRGVWVATPARAYRSRAPPLVSA